MRILVLSPEGFSGFGGIAKYTRDLLPAMAETDGVKEIVVIPRQNPGTANLKYKSVISINEKACRSKIHFVYQALRTASDGNWDIVWCSHLNLVLLSWFAAVLGKGRLVILVYGVEAWRKPSGVLLKRWLTRRATIVSISRCTLERLRSWHRTDFRKTFLLPNAMTLEVPGTGVLGMNSTLPTKPYLLTIGRQEKWESYKGVDTILSVLKELVTEDKPIDYVVIGGGTDIPRLRSLSRAYGLKDRVRFLEECSEDLKWTYLRNCRAFVMPGRGEGFGFVYLEALGANVPVVGSKLDGSFDALVGGKLGVLVDPRDPVDVMAGISNALVMSREDINTRSQMAMNYFGVDKFTTRVAFILRHVMAATYDRG